MSYDIDARLKAIAAEECRILRRKEMLVRIAILIGAFLCGVVACGGGEGGMAMMRDVIERALFHPGSTIDVPERLKSVPKRNTYDLQVGERYLIDGNRMKYLGMDGKYHMFESCAGSKESFTQYQLETAEVQAR